MVADKTDYILDVRGAISPFSLPVMQMGFDAYIELLYEQPQRFERLMQVNEIMFAGDMIKN